MKHQTQQIIATRSEITPVKNIDLFGGYKAPVALYDAVEKQVGDSITHLQHEKLYRLRLICGDEFWALLDNAFTRRIAGRCFAHMIYHGQFPFEFVQYKRSPTKRYQLLTN
ncbi:MAG: hypothetical protein PSV17_04165 [Methylotenera sp.]|uniref:hypothetical protein n=1 Tax=Methylotenera sp. TaxID=2051956 RepID=UPI002488A3BD|nr:hypothetical protein [Methylotenera sp.]MDI1308614.1 hypothetical protein [Methylotenera sp.]